MHITKVELRNFKHFTDLTIDSIPADTKLVLLIGPNGSGKSSVFDAFEIINCRLKISTFSYYTINVDSFQMDMRLNSFRKISLPAVDPSICIVSDKFNPLTNKFIPLKRNAGYSSPPQDGQLVNLFYSRSSFRHIPRLPNYKENQDGLNGSGKVDLDRPLNFSERDNRFENDINRISQQIIQDISRDGASAEKIRKKYIDPINQAFSRIFDGNPNTSLSLIEVVPPAEGKIAQINFRKGESIVYYDLLSAGEKEIFNVLFNLLARKDQYTDTVYFFDELDLHLNTRLQFNLLKEITENWIPENSQLWTASHSLGFIDYARQYEKGVIIDFDDLDFDQPQTLYPQPKERLDVYDIAVPKEMLFTIMKGKQIILCENQNDEYYNLLALPNTLFVGMKDARSLFLQIKNDSRYYALRDRDFLSDTEIERLQNKYPTYRILRYYDFENYLYHPDNIATLNPPGFDKDAYITEITRQKKERFNNLLLNLKDIRKSYEELKTDDMMDKKSNSIVDNLQSDDFERFYKYFDMKDGFNKVMLAPFNLDKKSLVQTAWFRKQIETILNP